MRKFIIDTDTASDDAIAMIAAFQNETIEILAITTVAGNVPLEQATENAKVVLDLMNVDVPLYKGAVKPLYRDLFLADDVHGADGLGNMNLPKSIREVENKHAVDAMIELVEKYPNEIELITLGPLTNIALAIQKAPQTMAKLKSIVLMAGNGLGPGNSTPYAEFNVYVDAESLQEVIDLDVPKLFVGWDVISAGANVSCADLEYIEKADTTYGNFTVACTKALKEYCAQFGEDGFALADPTAVLVALHPEMMIESLDTHTSVEVGANERYGQVYVDNSKPANATICTVIDANLFKKHLLSYLGIK